MPPAVVKAASNLAIGLPGILVTAALCWFVCKRLGKVKSGVRFRPDDIDTWPLSFILADAAIFVLAHWILSALPDAILQAVLRIAIILPITLLLVVLASFAFERLGIVKSGVPPRSVLIDAVMYTLIFSVLALFDASGVVIAAGISFFLAYSVAPRLAARFLR